jgi:type II secretory pathway component PulF
MATFRYSAEDNSGQPVAGRVDAAHADEARRLLQDQGLSKIQIVSWEPGPEDAPSLTDEEALEVTHQVAEISAAEMPLGPGLCAAAEECSNRRVASALRRLGRQLEEGRTWDEVIENASGILPRHVRGLLSAAGQTGRLGVALSELVEHQRATRRMRSGIISALVYPIFVACLAILVLVSILMLVTQPFSRMFDQFGLKLPMLTELLFWWRDVGLPVFTFLLFGMMVAALLARLIVGQAGWQQVVAGIPVFGPLSYWSGIAEWCGLLTVLLRCEISLPEALRLSGDGVRNAYIGRISMSLADGAARGRSLTHMVTATGQLPASLGPLIEWAEKSGNLVEGFASGQEMFADRVRTRAILLQMALPPILFISIGCSVLFVVGALFLPLIALLQGLS